MTSIDRYMSFVEKYARWILAILLLITLVFGYKIGGLTEDSNPYMLAENHPARQGLIDIRSDFTGTYDSILVVLYNPVSVFNQETLDAVFTLTENASKMMIANEEDHKLLKSLATKLPSASKFNQAINSILQRNFEQSDVQIIRELYDSSSELGLSKKESIFLKYLAERIDPIKELAGMSATENVFSIDGDMLKAAVTVNNVGIDPKLAERALMNNELMNMGVVDKEGKVTMVTIELGLLPDDSEGQIRAYQIVKDMVANYQKAHPAFNDEVYIAGVPVFFAEQKQIMNSDIQLLFPLAIMVIFFLLALFFRNKIGVLIPFLNVIGCVIWTLGTMAIFNVPLDLITSVLPIFLITICSSDVIHVLVEYMRQRQAGETLLEANRKMMRLMYQPVILTTLTTCVTFSLLATTNIVNLRNFGIFMAFGMFVALIISLLMIPAILSLITSKEMDRKEVTDQPKKKTTYLIEKALLRVSHKIEKNRLVMSIIFGSLLVLCGFQALRINVDDMGSGYFASSNLFRQADDFINSHIAGTSPGWIEIDTHKENGAINIETVSFIDKLENFIHQQENVSFSYSIARYIRRINFTLNDFNLEYNRLPYEVESFTDYDEQQQPYQVDVAGNDIIRQSVLMYENGGGTDLTNVLSTDFSKTTLFYTMNTSFASKYQTFLDHLIPWLDTNIPEGMSYKLAGSPIVWTAVLNEMWEGQKLGVIISFLSIFLILSVWFRSAKYGFFASLPLLFTVIFYFAFMSTSGIELNIGTAIISFLVLGVVDYSVHYVMRMREAVNDGHSIDQATTYAIMTAGRAIVINIAIFFIGFMPLLFSSFKPIFDVGLLVGSSLLLSGLLTIFSLNLLAPIIFTSKTPPITLEE